jgi:WD40 repeat protein
MRLWELESGVCLHTLNSGARSAVISSDSRYILSVNEKKIALWEMSSGRLLHYQQGHAQTINAVALSPDGRLAVSGGRDNLIHTWEFERAYEFPAPADWDEGARPYLKTFLALHPPLSRGLLRTRSAASSEGDFQKLLITLQYAGYGWLRPEGIRRALEQMATDELS